MYIKHTSIKHNIPTLNRTYVHYRQNRTYVTDRTEHTSIKHSIRTDNRIHAALKHLLSQRFDLLLNTRPSTASLVMASSTSRHVVFRSVNGRTRQLVSLVIGTWHSVSWQRSSYFSLDGFGSPQFFNRGLLGRSLFYEIRYVQTCSLELNHRVLPY